MGRMSKRNIKNARAGLWVASFALCCLAAFTFMKATQAGNHKALASLGRDPETTSSIEPKPIKWCGVAPWCR